MVNIAQKAEQLFIVRVIRTGLVSMIPVLLIGAFALVFKSFPVAEYQSFISDFAGGFLLHLFDLIYMATFGVLSVYMTLFITRSYVNLKADPSIPQGGAMACSLIAFFILAGVNVKGFNIDYMGAKSMFMAILTGLGASALYITLYRKLSSNNFAVLSRGADRTLNRMLSALWPIVLVTLVFAVFDTLIVYLFGVESFRELIVLAFNKLFEGVAQSFFGGFFFVLLSSVLWFFGIHGSDTLEGVMQEYFVPGLAENQAAVAAGVEPTCILTKQFFDCFVLIGGCGTTICLLVAILLFSRNRSRHRLGAAATIPMIFNMNEIMVFGLPIIYNPIMLIPFLVTPLVCYCTAYFAISSGMVPIITGEVEWTTPVFVGGYFATGSAAGSILQLVNVTLGVLIYMPFVRMLDRQTEYENRRFFDSFINYFRDHEVLLANKVLLEQQDAYGEFARNLTAELQHDMNKSISMHYQPQYNYEGKCVGVEALLRWNHPVFGTLYPPLVIKLAEEGGFLGELEEEFVTRALDDADRIAEKYGPDVKISFNVTGTTVVTNRFFLFCKTQNSIRPFAERNVCLEVTEQAALNFDSATFEALRQLKSLGLQLAIDDFTMGHTSVNYLRNNLFDYLKLDGSLVRGLHAHENCLEIISSVVQLADSLHMTVIAEYVETEEQRETLHEIGCDIYQGWLYSPAVSIANED